MQGYVLPGYDAASINAAAGTFALTDTAAAFEDGEGTSGEPHPLGRLHLHSLAAAQPRRGHAGRCAPGLHWLLDRTAPRCAAVWALQKNPGLQPPC